MKRKKRNIIMQPYEYRFKWKLLQSKKWYKYPILSLIISITLAMIVILILSQDLPSLSDLEKAGDPFLVTRIISSDGQVLSELYKQRRIKVPYEHMPKHIINATIANIQRTRFNGSNIITLAISFHP